MSIDELKKSLHELHEALEKAHTILPKERDMFGYLMSDMVLIAQGELNSEEHRETLRETLERKASDFDADHPHLAGVIRQVLEILNKMGI